MASTLSALSASVTRILYLTGFSKELKTKDIQVAFAEWESLNGGFKIKWRDDTSLLIVFQDASVAKRAYLHTLAYPPPILFNNSTGISATIKPYDGADAQNVIQNVNSRGQHNPNNPSRRSNSISGFPNHRNSISGRNGNGNGNGMGPAASAASGMAQHVTIPEYTSSGREGSPTLPSLPSHPTLNSLISSSLGEAVSNPSPPSDPAILATSLNPEMAIGIGGPRIGDPGKRMLGAALGVRHPGLGPRIINGGANPQGGVDHVERALAGIAIAE